MSPSWAGARAGRQTRGDRRLFGERVVHLALAPLMCGFRETAASPHLLPKGVCTSLLREAPSPLEGEMTNEGSRRGKRRGSAMRLVLCQDCLAIGVHGRPPPWGRALLMRRRLVRLRVV
jgi:hypothetical protein